MKIVINILMYGVASMFLSFFVYIYMLAVFNLFKVEVDVTDKKFSNAFIIGIAILIFILICKLYGIN